MLSVGDRSCIHPILFLSPVIDAHIVKMRDKSTNFSDLALGVSEDLCLSFWDSYELFLDNTTSVYTQLIIYNASKQECFMGCGGSGTEQQNSMNWNSNLEY